MPLTDRKAITPTTNNDVSKAEQVKYVDQMFSRIDFQAEKTNGGNMRIGYIGTSVLSAAPKGFVLEPGDSYFFLNANLKWIYVAGSTDGDAVTFNATD